MDLVTVRQVLRGLPARTVAALRGHDVLLYGAGVTFYAAVALVPGVLVATALLAHLVGPGVVLGLSRDVASALPSELGADRAAAALLRKGIGLPWLTVAMSVLPATVYGEGLRRAYVALAGVEDRLVGWRGRLAVVPLLMAAPLLLFGLLAVTPVLNELFGAGTWGRVGGVYLALNVDWLLVSVPLAWTFRAVAPGALPWRVCALGGLGVGAFLAGFLQGFVLFWSLPIDLGAPFGGQQVVGAVSALLLWLWLLHLVALIGWVATREAYARSVELTPPKHQHHGDSRRQQQAQQWSGTQQ